MTAPLISVIVPVYNVAGHVAACLDSLRGQSLADFEVIVVDDGSTDDSAARARAAAGDDARFRFVAQQNRGLSGARNAGLDLARGAFIAFVDSDDRVAPDYLARLHGALEDSGADWVACAIRFCHPDGGSTTHSAIHGAPDLAGHPAPRRYSLGDWREVIRHFPSAWNKLYRRSLIEGLRFDEGTWFEDHAFYYRAACRTDHLLHLPEPLYLQTRGREGQITATDSDQVFEQLSVLETLRAIMAGADKPGAEEGFERIATRLMFERSTALRTPARRVRFAAACRDFLARHGLRYSPGWDADISAAWGRTIAGALPLSVIVPFGGGAELLADTLASLEAQLMPDFELLIVCDGAARAGEAQRALRRAGLAGQVLVQPGQGQGAGPARNHGLARARGELVVFLDAGDRLMPWALEHWADRMLRAEADFGLSQFRVGLGEGHVHSGFHDMRGQAADGPATGPLRLGGAEAAVLHAHPSAKIFRRAFLREAGIGFGAGAFPEWQVTLRAALAARRAFYFATPGVEVSEAPAARALWRAPIAARDLARALDALAADLGPERAAALPPGWRRRLWARAAWEKLSFANHPSRRARLRFALGVAWQARRRGIARERGALDPYIDRRTAWILGAVRARGTGG
ncbi:glycosyltransferase [Actibacterium sp. MT2.3-13A]|uniref:glycosyltransferase family 2 protein n=1 Tax=Actibacterium sp. MT2.3-13A TaxID=2828332 RepID=UPI001BAE3191|nr:glycosyltransferase [Actibacterium sp. MT2.3-13A]